MELPADNPVIALPSLPGGQFQLEIQATDQEGRWQDDILDINIQVRPYYYKSWWFWSLLLLVAGCLSVAFYRYKVRQLKTSAGIIETISSPAHTQTGNTEP